MFLIFLLTCRLLIGYKWFLNINYANIGCQSIIFIFLYKLLINFSTILLDMLYNKLIPWILIINSTVLIWFNIFEQSCKVEITGTNLSRFECHLHGGTACNSGSRSERSNYNKIIFNSRVNNNDIINIVIHLLNISWLNKQERDQLV